MASIQQAIELHRAGRLSDAAAICRQILLSEPNQLDALRFLGWLQFQLRELHEAERTFARVLSINPADREAANARVAALQQLGRHSEAIAIIDSLLAIRPHDAVSWNNRGNLLLETGRTDEALDNYSRAMALDSAYPEPCHNRGVAYLTRGDLAAAEADFSRALELKPDYLSALQHRAGILLSSHRFAAAASDFDRLIALGAGDAAAWQGHGIALARLNHHDQALASLSESLRLDPANALTLYNRANILAGKNRYEEAARDLEALLSFDPEFPLAVGALLNTRLHVCDWREFDRHCEAIIGAIRAGKRLIHPFANLLISDSPADQLLCARLQTDEACPSAPQPMYRGERYRHGKIRIAYLSGDFYQHAVPFLIAGVLECHDRSRFEISGISFGGNDSSEMRDRLETACERFLDVPDKSDREIAQLVRELEIDIAIDLKGHTGGARPGIFAHRPAPIQVNYLGYPGTMGAPYMDYLLADRTLIPDGEQRFYAEQIVYLPDSYQANDSRRRISTDITRADAGLPQGAFVFCCFNGNQKILPQTFAAWMRILANSEGSVLWLLQDHASAANNLRREAQQRGVSAHRLIFAQHEPHERHLARLKLADLVLDTLPYGAHTTASDALRAGTPVLTRMGKSFAGRVAASLLTAVGHPELITHSEAEYEALACELAQNPSRLAEIKARLLHNRDVMPLFDTARMTRNLETAYLTMWQRHERGEQAAGFAVT